MIAGDALYLDGVAGTTLPLLGLMVNTHCELYCNVLVVAFVPGLSGL
jgi:hypothetical protein